jgi:hypothetical protein
MNDQANAVDQAEEEILTDTVSDETIEAAAGMDKPAAISWSGPSVFVVCC